MRFVVSEVVERRPRFILADVIDSDLAQIQRTNVNSTASNVCRRELSLRLKTGTFGTGVKLHLENGIEQREDSG
jgi:hypothetical protein